MKEIKRVTEEEAMEIIESRTPYGRFYTKDGEIQHDTDLS